MSVLFLILGFVLGVVISGFIVFKVFKKVFENWKIY